MKRLSFVQDLSPNHGVKRKDTPAFGLHEVRQELNEIEQQELEEEEEERIITASRQPPASGRFGRKNKIENGKMDFAQPIVSQASLHSLMLISSKTHSSLLE